MKRVEHVPTVARINVTPIIDVALVLVIILLITAPMIAATDTSINVPEATTRMLKDEIHITITLGKEGELGIDDEVVAPHLFVVMLKQKLDDGEDGNALVVIRADEATPFDTVRAIIKEVHSAGAKRIAVATRHRGVSQS